MRKLLNAPFTLLIHIALATIVAGALVTHFFGVQGSVTLVEGGGPVYRFDRTSGPGDGSLPFALSLQRAEVIYYPGTTTPMDFRSHLRIGDADATVAMNAVAEVDGWRFYQSGMGDDTSVLAVSHDPWGIGITYTGYALLLFGMAGFFVQRRTVWRSLLRKQAIAVVLLLFCCAHAGASEAGGLHVMQRPLAGNFGKVYVYWNDRVCPVQTMALDVTAKLYGSTSYRGLSAEQVLSGWLFYYDEWLRDYDATHPAPASEKAKKADDERRALIRWIGTGSAFRIYPYHAATGRMEWLSLSERRPSQMPLEQWRFMLEAMPRIGNHIMQGRNVAANEAITALIDGQRRYAGADVLPSESRFRAELFYNRYIRLLPAAILVLLFGALGICSGLSVRPRRHAGSVLVMASALAVLYFGGVLALRGWIGWRLPLTNGCETMLFMAFAASAGSLFSRSTLIRGALLCVGAMAAFVAAMAGKTPQIASLMPVLASPLLSVHVMIVMTSYVLFMLMAVLAAVGLAKGGEVSGRLAFINAMVLVPAVFLLAGGIFIGAVWANQSWGRYWGWDPKETCALVTMLIYSVPVHRASLVAFRRPCVLHRYLLLAIISVLFTYFGANYLLPGLHSYA
ncbi:MAG: cytochrome c biogenesis protein CcsA [Muribaculaceae bacterium]|nr:cytochrome c biogenesis protein CcsA [Muribaculaceae bacterium]